MDISEDIVPVICDLLNNVRTTSSGDGTNEISEVQQQLLRIEELDDRFDGLSLVSEIKRLIEEVISNSTTTLTSDIGVSALPLKKIESLRSQIFGAVASHVNSMDAGAIQQAVHYKKKPSGNGGGFSLFNFDDLPEFESLDGVISLLSGDSAEGAERGLDKLLKIEIEDLMEHPLWQDLLSYLYKLLSSCPPYSMINHKIMKVYHRLCVGLRGSSHQAVELMCSLCVHWASRFLATSPEDTESYCTPTRAQLVALTQTDTELNGFVALFSLIMRESVEALEAPGFHKEGDILVCLIFCLLANGTIELTEPESQVPIKVSIFTIVSHFTDESSNFVAMLSMRWSALAVHLHGIQSGLCASLGRRIYETGAQLSSAEAMETDVYHSLTVSWAGAAHFFFQFSLPYVSLPAVRQACVLTGKDSHREFVLADGINKNKYSDVLEFYKTKFEVYLNKKVNGVVLVSDDEVTSVDKFLSSFQSDTVPALGRYVGAYTFDNLLGMVVEHIFSYDIMRILPRRCWAATVKLVLKHVFASNSAESVVLLVMEKCLLVVDSMQTISVQDSPRDKALVLLLIEELPNLISSKQFNAAEESAICLVWARCILIMMSSQSDLCFNTLSDYSFSLSCLLRVWRSGNLTAGGIDATIKECSVALQMLQSRALIALCSPVPNDTQDLILPFVEIFIGMRCSVVAAAVE